MIRRLVRPKFILIFTLLVMLGAILVVSYSALSASNSIPLTRLGLTTQAIMLSDLLPSECSHITITNVVYCRAQGTCNGTNANDLIFGTPGNDKIQGKAGDDCILGGGGDDELYGDQGNDVCLGGPGTNYIDASCEYPLP
jgi:Ca2+-binding RTX toxin-like protein